MPIVSLLLPEFERCAAASGATSELLARWCTRGDVLVRAEPGITAALHELFAWPSTTLPVAALTRQADVGDAASALWLRADPAYVRADMTTARMLACGDLDLTPKESDELVRSLKPLFGDAGFPLEATTPARWYLRCPEGAQLPEFSAPHAALGADLAGHLPSGENGRRWRALLNEAQVILHNHPLNATRSAHGQLPANSLWFWGAGCLPAWVKSELTAVRSNDVALNALATQAGATLLAGNAAASGGRTSNTLLDLRGTDSAALASTCLAPLETSLRRRGIDELRLLFASGERWRLKPAHRWRFWRRLNRLAR